MAFRQPTHAPQRIHTSTAQEPLHVQEQAPQPAEEPQEWVLFSPVSVSDRTQTGTSITTTTQGERLARTPGRSRIADYSSLDYDEEDEEDGEDEELDSLDSHLPAFRADHSVYRNSSTENAAQEDIEGPVLPTHDGLGSFRIEAGEGIQAQLYAFEQYNPRRVKRRRESLELGDAAFNGESDLESQREREKTRRIEEWRMEQSRFLLEEIQRETRRRRKQSMSSASQQIGRGRRMSMLDNDENVETATLGGIDSIETGDEQEERNPEDHEGEGFWNRLTQTVIRDLMGIDDRLLAILFGEALPEFEEDDDLSTTPPANSTSATGLGNLNRLHDATWEHRLLERIAREFGILVNQLTDHPGAFSTYMRTRARERQLPLPYAGLPVIPESATSKEQFPERLMTGEVEAQTTTNQTDNDPHNPTFEPTLQSTTRPIDITTTTSSLPNPTPQHEHENLSLNTTDLETAEREYWERELDIKMVFRYLRSRFTSNNQSSSPSPATNSEFLSRLNAQEVERNNIQNSSASVVAARAARVRQYHPLARARPLPTSSAAAAAAAAAASNYRASMSPVRLRKGSGVESGGGLGMGLGSGRSLTHSSCKSQSAKWSGGSRNYWQDGKRAGAGSSLSGSMGISTGGMGAWGEV